MAFMSSKPIPDDEAVSDRLWAPMEQIADVLRRRTDIGPRWREIVEDAARQIIHIVEREHEGDAD